jgi:hypothetical protein
MVTFHAWYAVYNRRESSVVIDHYFAIQNM